MFEIISYVVIFIAIIIAVGRYDYKKISSNKIPFSENLIKKRNNKCLK